MIDIKQTNTLVTVLLGSACLGKSTALYQAVYQLFKENSNFQIIWLAPCVLNNSSFKDKIKQLLSNLPTLEKGQKWLIFYDSPSKDEIKNIHSLFFKEGKLERYDIKIVFSCRTIVWTTSCKKRFRTQIINKTINIKYLEELDEDEADLIIEVWKKKGIIPDQKEGSIKRPDFTKANLLKENDESKPSFLTAILAIKNQKIDDYVREKIESLLISISQKNDNNLNPVNILDAYACIVAMQKESLNFLTLKVLAKVINVDIDFFQQYILPELESEIIVSGYKDAPVRSSHKVIADIVYKIMPKQEFLDDNNYRVNFNKIYLRLAEAAQQLVLDDEIDRHGEEIDNWQFKFPKNFFDKKEKYQKSFAIDIAKTLFNLEENNKGLLTHLAQLYRLNNQAYKGSQVFRNYPISHGDRKYYHEWFAVEIKEPNKNYILSAWLCAIALSDINDNKFDLETIVIYLSDLGYAFHLICQNQYLETHQIEFLDYALGASVILGLSILNKANFASYNDKKNASINLEKNKNRVESRDILQLNIKKDFDVLLKKMEEGIRVVCEMAVEENNELAKSHKLPNQLKFRLLKRNLKPRTTNY